MYRDEKLADSGALSDRDSDEKATHRKATTADKLDGLDSLTLVKQKSRTIKKIPETEHHVVSSVLNTIDLYYTIVSFIKHWTIALKIIWGRSEPF